LLQSNDQIPTTWRAGLQQIVHKSKSWQWIKNYSKFRGNKKKLEQEIKQWKKIGFGGIPNNRNGAATFYFYESF
jgi:hypothetical protein